MLATEINPQDGIADLNTTLQKVKEVGAIVLIEREKRIRNGNVQVLLDPIGTPFAIQLWPYN